MEKSAHVVTPPTAWQSMAAEEEQQHTAACCCVLLAVIAVITLIFVASTSKSPVYSVTVTGVVGLDNQTSPVSPVFNLTVRIDHSGGRLSDAECIDRLSTVSVSYAGAVLGRGPVPQFCAGERKVRERGVTAWGKDVDLPQFLRDQLAGELAAGVAAVDVKVTTPAKFYTDTDTVFICSQAKIGGGPATCRKDFVACNGQQATPGCAG